jgi:hypothetical protein
MAHLTERLKKEYLPRLLKEFGYNCYQCTKSLNDKQMIFEHLNDKRNDSRYENIAPACQSCNIKKINDLDMKLKAQDLLKQREEAGFKYLENPTAIEEISSERQLNKILFSFTEQFVEERVNTDGKYLLSDAIAEIPYLCQKRFGAGAEPTIRRYLKQITCGLSNLEIVTDEKGKHWICKRILN